MAIFKEITDLHEASVEAFVAECSYWDTEPDCAMSLSQYSIYQLIEAERQPYESMNVEVDYATLTRMVALKREFDGASTFLYWSFADSLTSVGSQDNERSEAVRELESFRPTNLMGESVWSIDSPENQHLAAWSQTVINPERIMKPNLSLLVLADCADEFLHLRTEFDDTLHKSLNDEVTTTSVLEQAVTSAVYFDREKELVDLSQRLIETAANVKHENPVDLLTKALNELGFSSAETTQQERQLYTHDKDEF